MSIIYGNPIIIPSMEGGTVVSVQDTKALTITSHGTVSVTPDAPYDALKNVDVTVNVASGGGGGLIKIQNIVKSREIIGDGPDGSQDTITFDVVNDSEYSNNEILKNVIKNGDNRYLENVLRYLPNDTQLEFKKPSGEKITMTFENETFNDNMRR